MSSQRSPQTPPEFFDLMLAYKNSALLKAGVIGKVSEVHVWTNRPIWPQGGARPKPAENGPPQ